MGVVKVGGWGRNIFGGIVFSPYDRSGVGFEAGGETGLVFLC